MVTGNSDMRRPESGISLPVVAASLLLGGCATLEDFRNVLRGADRTAPVDIAERPLEEPIARNRFVLETPGQSVVGEPQIVFARDTDTFSDLAREYGLGLIPGCPARARQCCCRPSMSCPTCRGEAWC